MGVVTKIARFAGPVFTGLYAGSLVTLLVIELSLRGFTGAIYTQVEQINLIGIPGLAAATLIPAMVAAVLLVVATARVPGRSRRLAITALVLLLAVFTISSVVNVQITGAEGLWNVQAPPADWAVLRDRWQIAHAVRTIAAVVAFVCLSVEASTGRPRHLDARVRAPETLPA